MQRRVAGRRCCDTAPALGGRVPRRTRSFRARGRTRRASLTIGRARSPSQSTRRLRPPARAVAIPGRGCGHPTRSRQGPPAPLPGPSGCLRDQESRGSARTSSRARVISSRSPAHAREVQQKDPHAVLVSECAVSRQALLVEGLSAGEVPRESRQGSTRPQRACPQSGRCGPLAVEQRVKPAPFPLARCGRARTSPARSRVRARAQCHRPPVPSAARSGCCRAR